MILVVASHPETRKTLTQLIASKSYPVLSIDCGDKVVAHVRSQPTTLVVLDCDLEDSFDTLHTIRAEPRLKSLPVIMYSESSADLGTAAIEKGATAFIPKGTLDWAELFTEIKRYTT